jgi:fatty-acyl-CoA synthase
MSVRAFSGPTVGGLALRLLARYPQRIAFVDEAGRQTTYAAAADLIGRYQRVYTDHGLNRAATVGLLSANRMEAWCAGIAAQGLGMTVTWLHPLGSLADQRYQLELCEADALIVDEANHYERGGELGATFTLGKADYGIDLAMEVQRVGVVAPLDRADVGDIALINFTGGTTGTPRGVRRRHGQVVAMSNAILSDFELPACPRYLAIAPNSHVGGSIVIPVLARGGTIHLRTRFDPAAVVHAIEREHVNMTLLVPTMIYTVLDYGPLDSMNTSALELLLYGAAPIAPEQLSDGLVRLGPVFAQLYGQTECHPISYLSRADHTDHSLRSSCGIPTTATDVRLLDDDGVDVTAGEPGEIAVRSPAAMDSFLAQPDTREDGWLRTGDIARRDDRGYLHIADRKKDMIISGGFNVYPREVEDALTEHSDVALAAVFGVPDNRWGEVVTAAVVLRAGSDVDPAALIAHVRSRKGAVQAPKQLVIVNDLPRTAVGKIDKKSLKEMVQAADPSRTSKA